MFPEGNLMGNMQKKRAIFTELDQTLPQLHFLIDKNASLHNPLEGNIYLVQYIIYIYTSIYCQLGDYMLLTTHLLRIRT